MPYLTPDRKKDIDEGDEPRTEGELNYALTQAAINYVLVRYVGNHQQLNYDILNEVVGAFGGALAEFQRRVVDVYEDVKIENNGDVYDELLGTVGLASD